LCFSDDSELDEECSDEEKEDSDTDKGKTCEKEKEKGIKTKRDSEQIQKKTSKFEPS
jgi:hypothetical protein